MKPSPENLAARIARSVLAKRSPSEWISRINHFRSIPLRNQLACTVWFDFFSTRQNFRPYFSSFLDSYDPDSQIDPTSFLNALVSLGYVYSDAYRRYELTLEEIAYEKLHSYERTPTSSLSIPTLYSVYTPKQHQPD